MTKSVLPWPKPWPKAGTKGPDCPACERPMVWLTFDYVCHPCRLSYDDAQWMIQPESEGHRD